MLNYLSRSITDFLLLKEAIKTEEKEIYIYGVQLIISSIINFLICIITSLLFGELLNGLIFFVAFSSLRKFTGGFHSRSFLICNIVFTMIVVVALISNMLIGAIFAGTPMIVLLIILTMLCLILFSPVYNKNKVLTDNERKKFRIISIIVYSIHTLIYFGALIIFDIELTIIPICDLLVAIMIIWGIINNIFIFISK